MYLRLSDELAIRTVEVEQGALADYDAAGTLVGFEVIGLEDPAFIDVLNRLKARFASEAPALGSIEAIPA